MISNFKHPAAQKVCAKSTEINFSDIVGKLAGICEQRFNAYTIARSYAKGSKYQFDQKFQTIAFIRVELQIARLEMNQREAYKRLLRLENYFKQIAIRKNEAAFMNYLAKLDIYMEACRKQLNWKSQNAA